MTSLHGRGSNGPWAAFIPHVLLVLSPAHAGLDDEWDGYDMYDMDAGSGEEGRRRAAIAAELRPVGPTDCAAFDIDQIIADAADPVSPRLPPPVCLLRICRAGAY